MCRNLVTLRRAGLLSGVVCWVLAVVLIASWSTELARANADPTPPTQVDADPVLTPLREALGRAGDELQWAIAARALLAALDRKQRGDSQEAQWLVDRLEYVEPNAPEWAWRRSRHRQLMADYAGAIADLEKLVLMAPQDPLAIRALRALPELYLRVDDLRKSAVADERLLEQKLADPLPVLSRVIRTYEKLGFHDKAAAALDRLRAFGGKSLVDDPNLRWLAAEASSRAGNAADSAQKMIDFADQFPQDERQPEALLRAAQDLKNLGQEALALEYAAKAIERAEDLSTRARGLLEKADLLQRDQRYEAAASEYERVLTGTPDLMQVAVALHGLVRLSLEHFGLAETFFRLAAIAQGVDRFAAPLARRHIETLLRHHEQALAAQPIDAATVTELARRLGISRAVPVSIRSAAAQLREQVGDFEAAYKLYETVVLDGGEAATEARRAQMRCRPESLPETIAPDDLERLAALRRAARWSAVEEALTGRLDGRGGASKRTLAARAAFVRRDLEQVSQLLEPLEPLAGEAALLRGDARSLAGRIDDACADYFAAEPFFESGPEQAWLQVRLARCEQLNELIPEARTRLQRVLDAKPQEPIALAGRRALAQMPAEPEASEANP